MIITLSVILALYIIGSSLYILTLVNSNKELKERRDMLLIHNKTQQEYITVTNKEIAMMQDELDEAKTDCKEWEGRHEALTRTSTGYFDRMNELADRIAAIQEGFKNYEYHISKENLALIYGEDKKQARIFKQ